MLQFYTNYDKVTEKKDRGKVQDSILSDYLGNFKHPFCFYNIYMWKGGRNQDLFLHYTSNLHCSPVLK